MVKFVLIIAIATMTFFGGFLLESKVRPVKTVDTSVYVGETSKPEANVPIIREQTSAETNVKSAEEKPKTPIIEPEITSQVDRRGTPVKTLLTHVQIQLRIEPGTVNARRAAEIVNEKHVVLKPGDIFSYNEVVGERTLEKGFVYGTLPITGSDGKPKMIRSVGSGVCRLSVGLATAVQRAGLTQLEIKPHEYTPYYFGTNKKEDLVDATVYWGSGDPVTDNKFQNNKDYDIAIESNVDGKGLLTVDFYRVDYIKQFN